MPTYSISVRLQRTSTETAYVSVPLDDNVVVEQPDGTRRIDGARVMQAAVEMAKSPGIEWRPEDQSVQPHPIQQPRDLDEI